MTLFTDNPFEKMMIQKPDYGKREKSPPEISSPRCAGCVIMRRLFLIPRLALPALTRDSPLVWGTV